MEQDSDGMRFMNGPPYMKVCCSTKGSAYGGLIKAITLRHLTGALILEAHDHLCPSVVVGPQSAIFVLESSHLIAVLRFHLSIVRN